MSRINDTTVFPTPREDCRPSDMNIIRLIESKKYIEAYMDICMGSYADLKDRKFLILEIEGLCPYN